jgi:hypothetical protein
VNAFRASQFALVTVDQRDGMKFGDALDGSNITVLLGSLLVSPVAQPVDMGVRGRTRQRRTVWRR